jgi:hypothetical protein
MEKIIERNNGKLDTVVEEQVVREARKRRRKRGLSAVNNPGLRIRIKLSNTEGKGRSGRKERILRMI